MSGQPEDLQQWLNQLRKRAESQRGPAGHTPARRAPPRPSASATSSERARPLEEVLRERIREATGAEPPARPSPPRRQATASADVDVEAARRRVAEQARRREVRRKREAEAERQRAEERYAAEQKRLAEKYRSLKQTDTERVTNSAGSFLTGDPVRDLRKGPAVLREAILLQEILGPPLALRAPRRMPGE